jgi:hypothetical protein
MRRFLIASVLSLAVSPAFASSPLGRMAEQMAAACRADCLSQHATRTASSATQLQACTLRCSAASSFSQIHHPGARQAQGRGAPVRPAATPARGGAMPRTAAAPVALAAAPVAAPTAAQMGARPWPSRLRPGRCTG